MNGLHFVSYFFGGVASTNAVPHLVRGLTGHPFQSPFAKPSGIGLSSSKVNVLWGWSNLALAYVLVLRVGEFDIHAVTDVAPFALGGLAISLFAARHFGALHGGCLPKK